MALGIVCIITDAQKTNINLVFAARGHGPETFTRKLCTIDPSATPSTPPTHWLMSNAAGNEAELAILMGMCNSNQLPPLPDGVVWGENGAISAAAAQAAIHGSVFHVFSCAGNVEPTDHILGKEDENGVRHGGVLAGEGLQFVPEPAV